MKSPRSLAYVLGLTLLCATGLAQTAAPAAAAKPATPVKAVPALKLAWVNSSAFINEQSGIKQLVRVGKELELEFGNQQSELALQQEKLRTIVTELNKLQTSGATQEVLQAKNDEGLKLQADFQQKQQAFKAAVTEAQQKKQTPVIELMDKAMEAFSRERDIGMIFDVAKLGGAVVSARSEIDVTADFIAYFNAANP
jgi:Skp family chaperone for outer membrane proteins